jgi:cytochrome c5
MDQKNTSVDQESTSVHQSDSHGKEVYLRTCASCHDSGLSGAPKLGDKPAWNSHIAKGKEHLVQSALNGIGAMPAKGGDPTLSEDDIRAAVDYLIEQVR